MPTYEQMDDSDVVDRTTWYPHRFEVNARGESPFSRALYRGLYTNSDDMAGWLNERCIPALEKINSAFSGDDASTRQERTADLLATATQLLDPMYFPPEAAGTVVVASEAYVERLRGALYFILAYNIPEINIEHRACALSAAMRRPPFSTMSPDDPGHRATFESIASFVVTYVRNRFKESPAQGKRWLPWTVPVAGSGGTDRQAAISAALSIVRMCRWTADIEYFEGQAQTWTAVQMPDAELRSKLAEWMANCYEQLKDQVERIGTQ